MSHAHVGHREAWRVTAWGTGSLAVRLTGRPARVHPASMTIKLDALLIILGGFVLCIGAVLGFTPLSTPGGASCGSAFAQVNAYAPEAPVDIETCDAPRDARRGVALALLIPGALLALGGATARAIANPRQANLDAKPAARHPFNTDQI